MHFEFTVSVDVTRESGKFVTREEIAERIIEALDGADPLQVEVDSTTYNVDEWSAEAIEVVKPKNGKPDRLMPH